MPNGELSGSESGWRVYSPSPRANGSNDFVRPRESARGRTNRARRSAQLAVRARAARPNALNQRRGQLPWPKTKPGYPASAGFACSAFCRFFFLNCSICSWYFFGIFCFLILLGIRRFGFHQSLFLKRPISPSWYAL